MLVTAYLMSGTMGSCRTDSSLMVALSDIESILKGGPVGLAAAFTINSDESAPRPAQFRAVTLNVYKTFAVSKLAVYDLVVIPVASTEYAPKTGMLLI